MPCKSLASRLPSQKGGHQQGVLSILSNIRSTNPSHMSDKLSSTCSHCSKVCKSFSVGQIRIVCPGSSACSCSGIENEQSKNFRPPLWLLDLGLCRCPSTLINDYQQLRCVSYQPGSSGMVRQYLLLVSDIQLQWFAEEPNSLVQQSVFAAQV